MRGQVRRQPWFASLQDLAAAMPDLVSDRLELLALELHRAGRGTVQIEVRVLLARAALARIRSLVATLGRPATRRHLVLGAGADADVAASGHLPGEPRARPKEADHDPA